MSDERDSTANNLQTLRAFTEARDALGLAAQAYAEAVAALAAADVQTRPNPAIGQAVIVGTDESGGGVPYYVRDISKGDAYAPDTIYRVDPVVDGWHSARLFRSQFRYPVTCEQFAQAAAASIRKSHQFSTAFAEDPAE